MVFGRVGILLGIVLVCFVVGAVSQEDLDRNNSFYSSNDLITGDAIATGEVVKSNVTFSIAVVNFPALNLISPFNDTYIWNRVFLNYLVDYSEFVWYNVDNKLNVSINSPVELFLEAGRHVINIYAENEYGVSRDNVSFVIDPFLLEIRYDDYRGTKGGVSTDFNDYSLGELLNMSEVVLEQIDFGKIEFVPREYYFYFNESSNETIEWFEEGVIDVVNDSVDDGFVDIDSNVLMSRGKIFVNDSALPNFDTSGWVYFYDVGMTSPRLLKDGLVCSVDVCNNKSYVGGVFRFFASDMGYFELQEGYVPPSSGGGSSSSSGGGGGISTSSYTGPDLGILVTDFDKMSVSVKQGEIETREIKITNDGDALLRLEVGSAGLEGMISLDEYKNLVLNPGESRVLYLDIVASENVSVDNYLGKLFFRGEGVSKEVLLSVFVESMLGLFDVDVDVVKGGEVVYPGDYLIAEVDIISLGDPKRRHLGISYFIQGENGEVLFLEEEIGVIDSQLILPKTFNIPDDFNSGDYVLYVNVEHEGKVTGGSFWFEVGEVEYPLKRFGWIWIILVFLILFLVLWLVGGKKKKKKKRRKRVQQYY